MDEFLGKTIVYEDRISVTAATDIDDNSKPTLQHPIDISSFHLANQ